MVVALLETRSAFGKRRPSNGLFQKTQGLPGCPASLFVTPFGLHRFWVTPVQHLSAAHSIGKVHVEPHLSKNAPWADLTINPDLLHNTTRSCIRIFRSKRDHWQSSGRCGDGNTRPRGPVPPPEEAKLFNYYLFI